MQGHKAHLQQYSLAAQGIVILLPIFFHLLRLPLRNFPFIVEAVCCLRWTEGEEERENKYSEYFEHEKVFIIVVAWQVPMLWSDKWLT